MTEPSVIDTILPNELSTLLTTDSPPTVIDVREPAEWNIARIPGARLLPLGGLLSSAAELDRDADIVVYCHHGARSEAAAGAMLAMGFRHVRNLTGGIDRWSREVDAEVPRY
jgi:adenylyltransferase/sulfurtransferase